MLKNEREKRQRERFEKWAVVLANHLELSAVDTFDNLPVSIKTMLNGFKYIDVVLPLMQFDRDKSGLSFRQLEIKYGVTKSTIHRLVSTRELK
jgi:hypothetical protein